MKPSGEIISEIDNQIDYLMNIRAMFPNITEDMVGETEFSTAPFYQNLGFKFAFKFEDPLTPEIITEISQIGLWVNQNFIIRLCALLEYYGIIPQNGKEKIKLHLEGGEEVDLLRRLRNVLVHTNGRYNPNDQKEKQLYEALVQRFSLNFDNSTTAKQYPVPIDKLLLPIAECCKHYISASERYNSDSPSLET